jgi:hypothetical protein
MFDLFIGMLVDEILGNENSCNGEIGQGDSGQLQDVGLVPTQDGEGLEHYLRIIPTRYLLSWIYCFVVG